MKSTPDSNLFLLYLALIFWMPLPFGSARHWAEAILEIWVYALGSYWLWLYVRGKVSASRSFRHTKPVLWLFVIYLLLIVFQWLPWPAEWIAGSDDTITRATSGESLDFVTISADPRSTLSGFLLSCAYVLLFALSLLLVNSRKRISWLLGAIVLSGVFQALYGSFMTLSGVKYGLFTLNSDVATGTFINRNHLAGYLEMTLAAGIGLLIAMLDVSVEHTWKGRMRSWLRLLLSPKARLRLYLVMMVIALILTRSRMGNSAFFMSLLLSGVIGLALSRHATRGTVILLASLVVIDIFLVGTWFGVEKVAERIQQTRVETESRPIAYRDAYPIWSDHRLTGTGLKSFTAVFPGYQNNDLAGFYDAAHNDYLQFAIETGSLGLGVLGAIVIWTFIIALRAQAVRRVPLMRGLSFAVIMGLLARLIHDTVEFNFQIPANAAMFMIFLALGWISLLYKSEEI